MVKGRRTGVKNRGATLECLLSTLLVDLSRASEASAGERQVPAELSVHVEVGRGALLIEIESDGPRPAPDSWRYLLATELAAKIDASVTPLPEGAGYVVQFR